MGEAWPMVPAERAALIADLEILNENSWDLPSRTSTPPAPRQPTHRGGRTRRRHPSAPADVGTGAGPEVSGAVLSLLLAVTGRRVVLDDLDGPGEVAFAPAV